MIHSECCENFNSNLRNSLIDLSYFLSKVAKKVGSGSEGLCLEILTAVSHRKGVYASQKVFELFEKHNIDKRYLSYVLINTLECCKVINGFDYADFYNEYSDFKSIIKSCITFDHILVNILESLNDTEYSEILEKFLKMKEEVYKGKNENEKTVDLTSCKDLFK